MIPSAFWEGVGVGLGVSVAMAAIARWLLERWARRERPGNPTDNPAGSDPTPPGGGRVMTRPAADPPPAVGLPAEVREPARASNAAPSVQPADATAAVPTNGGQVRISQRVVFHIAAQGRIGPDEVAPRPLSQAGIGEALQVSQGALTGVLRRLVAAGVLEEKRQHVRGIDRRVKVYRLTPSGQQLYRELRRGTPPTDVTIRIPTRPRPARSVGAANPSPSVE